MYAGENAVCIRWRHSTWPCERFKLLVTRWLRRPEYNKKLKKSCKIWGFHGRDYEECWGHRGRDSSSRLRNELNLILKIMKLNKKFTDKIRCNVSLMQGWLEIQEEMVVARCEVLSRVCLERPRSWKRLSQDRQIAARDVNRTPMNSSQECCQ
jgi:hypothetical protein